MTIGHARDPVASFAAVPEVAYGVLEPVAPGVRRIVARNPTVFTARGTSTFVIGHGTVAVIDPGPAREEHVAALLRALSGEEVSHVLVTHTHIDHSPAAAPICAATGATPCGYGPHAGGEPGQPGGDDGYRPDHELRDGDMVEGPGWRLTAVHTPGHTANHLCYRLDPGGILFSGDHVMGWSTSVIVPPDGDMRAYRQSLRKLLTRDDRLYLPGHGAAIDRPHDHVRFLMRHRARRAMLIHERLEAGDRRIDDIVGVLYAGRPPGLQEAAKRTVLAHLIEMEQAGMVRCPGAPALDAEFHAVGLGAAAEAGSLWLLEEPS